MVDTGVSIESAAWPNVLFVRLAEQPPPSQKPECVPSGLISSATLLDTVVGPHAAAYCFQTYMAVFPAPEIELVLYTLLLSTIWLVPSAIPIPHWPEFSNILLLNCMELAESSAISPQPEGLCPPVMKFPCTTAPFV